MSSKRIAVLYGSETGNAHEFASSFSFKLHRFHFAHTLGSIGNFPAVDLLQCRYLFLICSTTGQGDLPRNVKENTAGESKNTLWTFLKRKNLPNNFLNHIKIMMIGLGDSSYPQFNFAIRKLHKRLVDQLGASEIFPRLEADELGMMGSNGGTGTGTEAVYFEFEKRALNYLIKTFPNRKVDGARVKREPIPDDIFLHPEYKLQLSEAEVNHIEPQFGGDRAIKTGTVCSNTRITHSNHFQDVRQFVFQTEGEAYEPGDTVAIYPHNRDDDVEAFLKAQPHWLEIADQPLRLEGIWGDHDGGLVAPLTLRNILKYHCEIMSIPRKSFFMKTWMFSTDETRLDGGEEQLLQQRDKLRQFAVDEDMDDLYDYCNRPRRSLLEVLCDFPSLKLPWEHVLSYLPIIMPRLFSISSAPSESKVELTVAIVKYKTILRKVRRGLCTDFLQALEEGNTIQYKLQNNFLLRPQMKPSPAILISPGVGLAPMMCLIKADFFQDIHLFFGNRVKSRDFLYEHDLENWHKEGKIQLHTCFSRDPSHSPTTKYVQDVMWQKGEILADLIVKKNAVIYICGSSGKMPVQVRLTILEILKKWSHLTESDEAEKYLRTMERESRYLQETW
ncbi:LAME_0F03004g1_1 [Lachancea meyersii CBS 8951]|uniref:NADPH-dependent diflavin oxidoreductase 1 n=1 Tax=Lachancea meyersii CBS 8951 TaxID=1266667 RepID=A0A1G4JQX0_9SACH|nr:LAME_0F03004g1_1 [Lachancea meyersii CBS 8951]